MKKLWLALILLVLPFTAFAESAPWQWQNPRPQGNRLNALHSVFFLDQNRGWAVGTGGILRTVVGGQTWADQPSGTSQDLNRIEFNDDNNGWIVGVGGTILRTTDGGETWSRMPSGTSNNLWGVSFIDDENGWVVGTEGTILRFIDEDVGTGIEKVPEVEGASPFVLAQNHPNPFSPTTTISFTLARSDEVRLEVFDMLGRLVEVLVEGSYGPGAHAVTWNGASRPKGVYFYRLQSGARTEVRKMVLVR